MRGPPETRGSAPRAQATQVRVTTSNPGVLSLGASSTVTLTLAPGETVVPLPISSGGLAGEAALDIEVGDERLRVHVVVGTLPASRAPAVVSPVIGVRVQ